MYFYNHVLLFAIQKVKERKKEERDKYECPRQRVFNLVEKILQDTKNTKCYLAYNARGGVMNAKIYIEIIIIAKCRYIITEKSNHLSLLCNYININYSRTMYKLLWELEDPSG